MNVSRRKSECWWWMTPLTCAKFSRTSSTPILSSKSPARPATGAMPSQWRSLCRPDVITMDINMPHLDGLQATEMIMSQHPRPIVIVSSESREGAREHFAGARTGCDRFRPETVERHRPGHESSPRGTHAKAETGRESARGPYGDSFETLSITGICILGPSPARIGAGSLSHKRLQISYGCDRSLDRRASSRDAGGRGVAKRLSGGRFSGAPHAARRSRNNSCCNWREAVSLPVKEAETNETAQPGVDVSVSRFSPFAASPPGRILLDPGPRIDGYRPCADVALETVSAFARALTIGVVLTGMGQDAAEGRKSGKARAVAGSSRKTKQPQ